MSGRSQVTITLGRGGQVVKRGREAADYEELGTSGGGKRSVRDRLGNGPESPWSKRRRETSDCTDEDDTLQDIPNRRVGRDDLRFKLMNKRSPRRSKADAMETNERDLRETLSRINRNSSRFDVRDRMLGSKSYDHSRQLPPARSADDLLRLDSQRKPYSGWNFDEVRQISPGRLLGASRALSPSSRLDDPRHIPTVRSANPSRPLSVMTTTVVDSSRTGPFTTKPRVPGEPQKPIMHLPPPNVALPKNSYAMQVEEPPTVAGLLHSLGLGKYAIAFQAEEVDMTALRQMSDHDLKEMGIPMGPRKKILLAVAPRVRPRLP